MKIIIVGCGKVGKTIATVLTKEHHDIVMIDSNEKVLKTVCEELDVIGYEGDGASYETLLEAGVKDADLLIAATNSDELNLLCCLFAKKAGNVKTIARVRKHLYYDGVRHIRDELGLAKIINPDMEAAKEIASLLQFPSAVEVESFGKGRVGLLSFSVKPDSMLVGKMIRDIIPQIGVDLLVCGIERNDEAIIPNGNTVIEASDKMTIAVSPSNGVKFFNKIGYETGRAKSVLIIGGSNTSYYLAKMLLASSTAVTIIEINEERSVELSELLPEATVLCADGADEQVLIEEGIKNFEAVASLTGIDEENILVSLYASNSTKAKVITKLNHIGYDQLLKKLDLGSVISPKNITAQEIITFVRAMDSSSDNEIETLHKILGDKAEALSFRIKEESEVTNVPLLDLKCKDNLLIGAIVRNGVSFTPTGKDEIKVGDSVMVVTTHLGLKDISDILA